MIALAAVRTALAGFAPPNWYGYDRLPGDANLPAFVVDLPTRLTTYAGGLVLVELPVWLAVRPDRENELLDGLSHATDALEGAQAASWEGCRVVDVNEFGTYPSGPSEVLAATVNLSLLVPRTTPPTLES